MLLPIVGCGGEWATVHPADAGASFDGGDAPEEQYADASFSPEAGDLLSAPSVVQVGVFSDLHHGLASNTMKRLERFVQEANRRKPAFIIQLGDFNYSTAESHECIELWEQHKGKRYHVLGNHDLDKKTKQEVTSLWAMRNSFYSFDHGNYHFAVIDRANIKTGNTYIPYGKGNYYYHSAVDYVDPEQLEWLNADLMSSTRPTVVFMHQGLGMPNAFPPDHPNNILQELFEKVNLATKKQQVVACFFGHGHADRYNKINGIHYVGINSISYCWLGGPYGGMSHYKDPLFTFIHFGEDAIEIEGHQSQWQSPTPEEKGYPNLDQINSVITYRKLRI